MIVDPTAVAGEAGLHHVSDARPGITRRRRGKGFSYHRVDGSAVNTEERRRIEAIVIPPAWTDVWICERPDGHILATGRDDRGRKQYRYHPRWQEVRDATKFDALRDFGHCLPGIRARMRMTWPGPAYPRTRCWRRWCTCWTRPSSASATTSTPWPTTPTG